MAQSFKETLEACWEAFEPSFTPGKSDLVQRFAHVLRESVMPSLSRVTVIADNLSERIGTLAQFNDNLAYIFVNESEAEKMSGACGDLNIEAIALQCDLSSPTFSDDEVHNFIEGLEETLEQSHSSTHRLSLWLNGLIKDLHRDEALAFA